MQVLDTQLGTSGPFAAEPTFTLADVVLGLSVHRWRQTPIERLTHRSCFAQLATPRPAMIERAAFAAAL